MNRRKLKVILIFLLLFGLAGYFREFFFLHTNRIMFGKYYQREVYEHEIMPFVMRPLTALSYNTLYYLKYVFTLCWVIVFYLLNYFALKKITSNPVLVRTLNICYLLILAGAGLFMAYGYLVMERLQDDEYTLSHWLLGIAQSPLICLILLASERLFNKPASS